MSSIARRRWDADQVSLSVGLLGAWLLLIAFGVPVLIINGGFSVAGLNLLCQSLNDAGRVIWAGLEAFSFTVPAVPGLPRTQPILPWIGVLASSLCQIVMAWRKFSGRDVPTYLVVATGGVSAYDFGTTLMGLSDVAWLKGSGSVVRGVIALFLTFALELAIGALLPRGRAVRPPRRARRWRASERQAEAEIRDDDEDDEGEE